MRSSLLLTDASPHPCPRFQAYTQIPNALARYRFTESVKQTQEHLADVDKTLILAITTFQRCRVILAEENERLAIFLQHADTMVPQPPSHSSKATGRRSSGCKANKHTTKFVSVPVSRHQTRVTYGVRGPTLREKVVCDSFLFISQAIKLVTGPRSGQGKEQISPSLVHISPAHAMPFHCYALECYRFLLMLSRTYLLCLSSAFQYVG